MACLEDLLVHQDLQRCRVPAFVDSALRERCGVSPWSSDESHPFGWLWQNNVLALREWRRRAASLVTAFNQSPEAFGKHVQYKKVGQFLLVWSASSACLRHQRVWAKSWDGENCCACSALVLPAVWPMRELRNVPRCCDLWRPAGVRLLS